MDDFCGNFARTRTNAQMEPDVTLEVDGIEFETVRSVLIAKSPYFAAMFSGNFKEKFEQKISIKDVSPTSMKILLDSMSKESLYIDGVDLIPTLQAACMLQFENVRDYCVSTIVETLSHETCLEVYFAAIRLDFQTLARKALCVALIEFKSVVETRSFSKLNVDQVRSYLSHRALHVDSEIDVFDAAMNWWYEYERNDGSCVHGHRDDDGDDAADVEIDGCTEKLLMLLQCVDYKRLDVVDIKLFSAYPGIGEHKIIKNVIEHIVSIKSGRRSENEVGDEDEIVGYAKRLLGCASRTIPKIPCIIGVLNFPPNADGDNKLKTDKIYQSTEKSFVLYYDRSVGELKPLIELKHVGDFGLGLEGYRVEVWKNKVLLLGGEFMYGLGHWSRSCWSYDMVKDKWSRFATLPSVRRHFKTCVVRDELYIIGGIGQYRVIQNNMYCYNLKTDVWSYSIAYPYNYQDIDLRDMECCEYNGSLFVTCGSRGKIETLSYDPQSGQWSWLRIVLSDPDHLYDNFRSKDTILSKMLPSKNFSSFVPFVIDGDLYISGKCLLGLKQCLLDLEIFYFGPGIESYDDGYESVGTCIVDDVVFSFCSDEMNARAIGVAYDNSVRQFSVTTKRRIDETEIRDRNVRLKHSTGCFSLFDYNSLSFDDTIRSIDILQ